MKELLIIQIPLDNEGRPIISLVDCAKASENLNKWIDDTKFKIIILPTDEILSNKEYDDLIVINSLTKYDFYNLLGVRGKWFNFKSWIRSILFNIKLNFLKLYWKIEK